MSLTVTNQYEDLCHISDKCFGHSSHVGFSQSSIKGYSFCQLTKAWCFHLQATLITWTITKEVKTTCFYCISKNQFTLIIVFGDRKWLESLKGGVYCYITHSLWSQRNQIFQKGIRSVASLGPQAGVSTINRLTAAELFLWKKNEIVFLLSFDCFCVLFFYIWGG